MAAGVRQESVPCPPGIDGTVFVLEDPRSNAKARIWPALGFNCYSWTLLKGCQEFELLWADPNMSRDPRPTRSGIPLLFPFPNRIRAGRFAWNGQECQLPINDAQGRNAIHGFVCQRRWHEVDAGVDERGAWVTGRFLGSRDAPECVALWPADYRLEATYRLRDFQLVLDVAVKNPGGGDLPFGFGIHPYFRCSVAKAFLQAPPLRRWLLEDCLPAGTTTTLEGKHAALARGEPIGAAAYDDAYQFVEPAEERCVTLHDPARQTRLILRCGTDFRELVVFTPPHREALCLEPYSCMTDAINLQARGVDAGLKTLRPGESWTASIRLEADIA